MTIDRNFVLWAIAMIVWGVMTVLYINNDYMSDREYNVKVVHKMEVEGSKGRTKLSVVYELENGLVFDRYVSPSTFYLSRVGQDKVLLLRPFDVRQTRQQNFVYFFLPIVNLCGFITCLIFSLIFQPWKSEYY